MGRDGRVALVNASAERLFGARAEELLGLRTEDMIPERYRERHIAARDRYFAEPWAANGSCGSFLTILDGAGRERKVFALPEPIATEDGLWVSILLHLPDARGDVEGYALRPSTSTPATAWAMEPKAV